MFDPQAKEKQKIARFCKQFIEKPLTEPLSCSIIFNIKRPANHYRSGKYKHLLKESVTLYHVTVPDIDNLVKFYLDALNKVAYDDDRQIVELRAVKRWCEFGVDGSVEIELKVLS